MVYRTDLMYNFFRKFFAQVLVRFERLLKSRPIG